MKIVNDINAEDLFELRKQLGWKDINIEQIKKGLKNTEYKISIYEDDTMVACGRIVSDYSFKGVLSDVMVNPDYQGKGYGKNVVTTLFKNVRDNLKVGEKYQIEATPTSGNRDFYVKCGMKYKPEVQDGTFLWIDKSLHKLHLLDKYFCLIKNGSKTKTENSMQNCVYLPLTVFGRFVQKVLPRNRKSISTAKSIIKDKVAINNTRNSNLVRRFSYARTVICSSDVAFLKKTLSIPYPFL